MTLCDCVNIMYVAETPLFGIQGTLVQGAIEFYLGALSRIHVACGPLIEEAIKGFCEVDVTALSRVARTMLKSRTDSLCEATLAFSERLGKLADRRTGQVPSPHLPATCNCPVLHNSCKTTSA
jgi:hypothetical protein